MIKMGVFETVTFHHVRQAVEHTYNTLHCSGAALVIFQRNELQIEQYWGKQSAEEQARPIQPTTKFHLASCRKSYVAFAVAYAIHHRFIQSLDDEIVMYFPENEQKDVYKGTTIRHLVTHCHGLTEQDRDVVREFEAGTKWAYRGINVELISKIIQFATNKTIADIVQQEVFVPLQLTETNWYNTFDDTFVDVIGAAHNKHWSASRIIDGSKMNMYASARELAKWGLLHLNEGTVNGEQIIDRAIFQLATALQSEPYTDVDAPENGIFWFVQSTATAKSEIGEFVPKGAYQILGYTTVTLLVIPSKQLVAVRAFNSFGNSEGYDYLEDVRAFGNYIMQDVQV